MSKLKEFCDCGGVIFADTEDWENPVCYNCYEKINSNNEESQCRVETKDQTDQWPIDRHGDI